jgi:hypothetical protein
LIFSSTIYSTEYIVKLKNVNNQDIKIKLTYNEEGFDSEGIHKDTGTRVNEEGLDEEGFDIEGLGVEECQYDQGQEQYILYDKKPNPNYYGPSYEIHWGSRIHYIWLRNYPEIVTEFWNPKTMLPVVVDNYSYYHTNLEYIGTRYGAPEDYFYNVCRKEVKQTT